MGKISVIECYAGCGDPRHPSACGVAGERYFKCHHKSGTAIDVVAIEIAGEVAISFTHSQYDTRTHSHCIISQVM
jgi:hypothetical protein